MENKKENFFTRLKKSLSHTAGGMLAGIFMGDEHIDDDFFDELEEAMIIADMGMETAEKLISALKDEIKSQKIVERSVAKEALIKIISKIMKSENEMLVQSEKSVVLIVGVNGVGKTTSIGKLANYYKQSGKKVLLAAGDTFRAAAAEQLTVWAQRADVSIIKHQEGSDPAAVVYDAIASFKAKDMDVLLCDTAGRLHNKKNLMSELEKIRRVIDKELGEVNVEVLLVLDATTGQNAIIQAKTFKEAAQLTGVIITKLDGTAKGGMAVAIKEELGLPVRFIGIGEGMDDLQPFDADEFANALL